MQDVFLGIDVGSATVKVAGVNASGTPVGEPVYLRHDAFAIPLDALQKALSRYLGGDVQGGGGAFHIAGAGTTGSGRELTRSLLSADLSRTEIMAHAEGIAGLMRLGLVHDAGDRPLEQARTLIEIGGQDSKIILFGDDGLPSFFHMNSICSAGTGEFLKQLADEAGIDVAEFGPLALRSTAPAAIDSTCTVFARRDFRHLTQKGVPLEDRLMGVCEAMTRNFIRTVAPEGSLRGPVLFQGGVAYNDGVRRAFEQHLGLPITVPPMHAVAGALGMAWIARRHALGVNGQADRDGAADTVAGAVADHDGAPSTSFRGDFAELHFQSQVRYCHGCANACDLAQPVLTVGGRVEVLEAVGGRCEGSRNPINVREEPQTARSFRVPVVREPLPARQRPRLPGLSPRPAAGPAAASLAGSAAGRTAGWLRRLGHVPGRSSEGRWFAGLDGGSRGTKYAVVRSRGQDVDIVDVGAISTGGDAVQACLNALEHVQRTLPPGAALSGIGTTGSAGELFRDIVSHRDRDTSDYRSTEILAHYAWAAHRVPDVATVIDIGGNDAKIVAVKSGGLDFAMNDKCAAGTGAFLEAVARRFHVPVEDYGEVALSSASPARIAGRCAVFGESDVVHKARLGYAVPDLLLGVAYSICRTYLSDVARGVPLRLPLVAQGGAFLNTAVQEAFRHTLDLSPDELRIARDPREIIGAGALGAALLSRGMYEQGLDTAFKGFDAIARSTYRTAAATCRHARCGRTCPGVVALLENDRPVAGYRSVDCPLGLFDGRVGAEDEAEYVASLVGNGSGTEATAAVAASNER